MRLLTGLAVLLLNLSPCISQDKDKEPAKDSPIVAKSRKKLETKVTVNFKDERLKDALKELFSQAELNYRLDTKGGVSQNQAFTYSCDEKPLKEALDEMFKARGLGYIIHRKQNNSDRYEGYIDIVQGDQRGDDASPKKPDGKEEQKKKGGG